MNNKKLMLIIIFICITLIFLTHYFLDSDLEIVYCENQNQRPPLNAQVENITGSSYGEGCVVGIARGKDGRN